MMERQDPYMQAVEKEILKKLGDAASSNIGTINEVSSLSYQQFKEDEKKNFVTFFEKFCVFSYRLMPWFKLPEKAKKEYTENIEISTLNVDPNSLLSVAVLTFLLFLLFTLPCMIMGWISLALFFIITGAVIAYIALTYPKYAASIITIRAQQESLLAILYMSLFLRVNPVIESAIVFATEHLNGPLGKDLKQVLWLLETERAGNVEDAIKYFIPLWVKRNMDFVRSFLILHSLAGHSDPEARERVLDKALEMILSNTHTKMKHYSFDLKTPVMILNSFGLMLPLIGLIAFPMLSIFLAESVNMSYLFFGYLIVLPGIIWFFMRRILSKRPGAFSFPDISNNPTLPPEGKFVINIKDKELHIPVLKVALFVGILVMIPGIYQLATTTIPYMLSVSPDASSLPVQEYSMTAMFLTMTIPIGFALIFIIYFLGKSMYKLKLRNRVMEIENDLSDTLFQFGNQFTEQIPIESAVKNYIQESEMLNMKKQSIYHFFVEVRDKIENQGLTFKNAIFEKNGSLLAKYPSVILKEVLWIITEGAKKGSKVLYRIIANISTYLENTKKIKELIYDLLVETSSSVKVQVKFLAPFLAGVVGSLTLIIVKALSIMSEKLEQIMRLFQSGRGPATDNLFGSLFNFAQITPPTVFQVLVGIYLVEAVILLSMLANGVDNGFDNVSRDDLIAKNLIFAMIVYIIVIVVGVYALNQFVEKGIVS